MDIYVSNGQRKCSETSPGLSEGLLGFTMFTLDEHKKEVYTTMQRVQNKKKKKEEIYARPIFQTWCPGISRVLNNKQSNLMKLMAILI